MKRLSEAEQGFRLGRVHVLLEILRPGLGPWATEPIDLLVLENLTRRDIGLVAVDRVDGRVAADIDDRGHFVEFATLVEVPDKADWLDQGFLIVKNRLVQQADELTGLV